MFLPPAVRIAMIGLYVYFAWKFLSLGAIVVGAGLMAAMEVRPEAPILFPIGALFMYVGARALDRLRHLSTGAGPGI
jgi:hypothetical protein